MGGSCDDRSPQHHCGTLGFLWWADLRSFCRQGRTASGCGSHLSRSSAMTRITSEVESNKSNLQWFVGLARWCPKGLLVRVVV